MEAERVRGMGIWSEAPRPGPAAIHVILCAAGRHAYTSLHVRPDSPGERFLFSANFTRREGNPEGRVACPGPPRACTPSGSQPGQVALRTQVWCCCSHGRDAAEAAQRLILEDI